MYLRYTKFVKSKDLSNASSQDLACIFGQRSRSTPSTPQLSDVSTNKLYCQSPLISFGKDTPFAQE